MIVYQGTIDRLTADFTLPKIEAKRGETMCREC